MKIAKIEGFHAYPAALLLTLGLALPACASCEDMVEKVCSELGPEDCETWKSIGGPDQVVPGGRKANNACRTMMNNEQAMKGSVLGARGAVLAHEMQEAANAGDTAKIEEIKKKLDENTKAIQGMAK